MRIATRQPLNRLALQFGCDEHSLFHLNIFKTDQSLFPMINFLALALGSRCHLLQYGWTIYALGSNVSYRFFQWPGNLRSRCSDTGKCVDKNFPKSVSVMIFTDLMILLK